jgi:hypothetical protein
LPICAMESPSAFLASLNSFLVNRITQTLVENPAVLYRIVVVRNS